MKIIPPIQLDLLSKGTTPVYVHPVYVINTYYSRYDIVRRQINGVWYSYRALSSFYSELGPVYTYTTYWWEFLGAAPTTGGLDYATDGMRLSLYADWTSGSAVAAGTINYDASDHNDYVALLDIDSGDNTTRPSAAVVSNDDDIASLWRLYDAANAWALIDYANTNSTEFVNDDDEVLEGTRTLMFSFSNPSVNDISLPNDFSTGYTPEHATITNNNQTDPIGGTTADTLTAAATATPSVLAILSRSFDDYPTGTKVVFGVFVKSDNVTSFDIRLNNASSVTLSTFAITNTWRYVQAVHEVTEGGGDRLVYAHLGRLTAPGKRVFLWGAHFGLAPEGLDHVAVMGLSNVSEVGVSIIPYADFAGDKWTDEIRLSATLSAPTRKNLLNSTSFIREISQDTSLFFQSNTGLYYPTETTAIALDIAGRDQNLPASVSSLVIGEATTIGYTEWGVEISLLSFSRKERDDTFGTVKFVKRGSASSIRATAFIDTDQISADEVYHILSAFDGQPIVMDFNNPGSDYERLKLFGFYTNVRTIIQADSYESLGIDVESLVQ